MDRRHEIARRFAFLQAELSALAALIDLEPDAAPAEAAPAAPAVVAPAPVAAAPAAPEGKKPRFSYLPGTTYRISGLNPFRSGNNLAFFDFLREVYGDAPFSREQLEDAFAVMTGDGRIDTVQTAESFIQVFLSTAGAKREAIEVVDKPAR